MKEPIKRDISSLHPVEHERYHGISTGHSGGCLLEILFLLPGVGCMVRFKYGNFPVDEMLVEFFSFSLTSQRRIHLSPCLMGEAAFTGKKEMVRGYSVRCPSPFAISTASGVVRWQKWIFA